MVEKGKRKGKTRGKISKESLKRDNGGRDN